MVNTTRISGPFIPLISNLQNQSIQLMSGVVMSVTDCTLMPEFLWSPFSKLNCCVLRQENFFNFVVYIDGVSISPKQYTCSWLFSGQSKELWVGNIFHDSLKGNRLLLVVFSDVKNSCGLFDSSPILLSLLHKTFCHIKSDKLLLPTTKSDHKITDTDWLYISTWLSVNQKSNSTKWLNETTSNKNIGQFLWFVTWSNTEFEIWYTRNMRMKIQESFFRSYTFLFQSTWYYYKQHNNWSMTQIIHPLH